MRHMRVAALLAIAAGLAACSGSHEGGNVAGSNGTGNDIGAVDEVAPANAASPVDNGAVAAENALDVKSADGNAADPLGNAGEATTNAL